MFKKKKKLSGFVGSWYAHAHTVDVQFGFSIMSFLYFIRQLLSLFCVVCRSLRSFKYCGVWLLSHEQCQQMNETHIRPTRMLCDVMHFGVIEFVYVCVCVVASLTETENKFYECPDITMSIVITLSFMLWLSNFNTCLSLIALSDFCFVSAFGRTGNFQRYQLCDFMPNGWAVSIKWTKSKEYGRIKMTTTTTTISPNTLTKKMKKRKEQEQQQSRNVHCRQKKNKDKRHSVRCQSKQTAGATRHWYEHIK